MTFSFRIDNSRKTITNFVEQTRKVKIERAKLVLQYIDTLKMHEMWAKIELELQEENRLLDLATIEYTILMRKDVINNGDS